MDKPYRKWTKVGLWVARVFTVLFALLMAFDAYANATARPPEFDAWNVFMLLTEVPILVALFVRPRVGVLAQIASAFFAGGHSAGAHPTVVTIVATLCGVGLNAGLWWALWRRLVRDEAALGLDGRPEFAAD